MSAYFMWLLLCCSDSLYTSSLVIYIVYFAPTINMIIEYSMLHSSLSHWIQFMPYLINDFVIRVVYNVFIFVKAVSRAESPNMYKLFDYPPFSPFSLSSLSFEGTQSRMRETLISQSETSVRQLPCALQGCRLLGTKILLTPLYSSSSLLQNGLTQSYSIIEILLCWCLGEVNLWCFTALKGKILVKYLPKIAYFDGYFPRFANILNIWTFCYSYSWSQCWFFFPHCAFLVAIGIFSIFSYCSFYSCSRLYYPITSLLILYSSQLLSLTDIDFVVCTPES